MQLTADIQDLCNILHTDCALVAYLAYAEFITPPDIDGAPDSNTKSIVNIVTYLTFIQLVANVRVLMDLETFSYPISRRYLMRNKSN